mgnify:CR=1 FL=1
MFLFTMLSYWMRIYDTPKLHFSLTNIFLPLSSYYFTVRASVIFINSFRKKSHATLFLFLVAKRDRLFSYFHGKKVKVVLGIKLLSYMSHTKSYVISHVNIE